MLAIIQTLRALFLISLVGYSMAEATRSIQIGDVTIKITLDKLHCDRIVCPLATGEVCLITKVQDRKDPSVLVRSNYCRTETGQDQISSITRENIDPKTKVRVTIRVQGNGEIELQSYERDLNLKVFNENRYLEI